MSLLDLAKGFLKHQQRTHVRKHRNKCVSYRPFSPTIEALETRQLMAGDLELVSHDPSAVYTTSSGADTATLAFDGSRWTAWNSRSAGSAWIQVDLGAQHEIDRISLDILQSPSGHTSHQVWVSDVPIGNSTSGASQLASLKGVTSNGQILEVSTPAVGRYVQVQTVESPSWVAWREVQVYGTPSPERRESMAADMMGVVGGNGIWAIDTDRFGAADIDFKFGLASDTHFVAGDWIRTGTLPGVVRPHPDGLLHWYLDRDGDPWHEKEYRFGRPGDTPVTGDWNGDGRTGLGVVRQGSDGYLHWYIDTDGDPTAEIHQVFGLAGDIPVVGDWDNNGTDNVGVFRAGPTGYAYWHMDVTGDAWPEVSRLYGLNGDRPVVGDWDGNGRTDIGVARPLSNGLLQWHLDVNGDPYGDIIHIHGGVNDTPIVGHWKLPEVAVFRYEGGRRVPVVDGQAGRRTIEFPHEAQYTVPRQFRFEVENRGTKELNVGKPSVPRGFIVDAPDFPAKLSPGHPPVAFYVRLDTQIVGVHEGQIRFSTSDGNENPFNFVVRGHVGLPEIAVAYRRQDIVDGSRSAVTLEFAEAGKPAPIIAFEIKNLGTSDLRVDRIVIPPEFKLISRPYLVLPKQSNFLRIQLRDTKAVRTVSGEVVIHNDDANENPFNFKVYTRVVSSR